MAVWEDGRLVLVYASKSEEGKRYHAAADAQEVLVVQGKRARIVREVRHIDHQAGTNTFTFEFEEVAG